MNDDEAKKLETTLFEAIREPLHDAVAEHRLSIPTELHDGPALATVANKLKSASRDVPLALDDREYEIASALVVLNVGLLRRGGAPDIAGSLWDWFQSSVKRRTQ